MEELDRKIVALLAADGRLSYTDLGRITGLSTSAAHQRVKRLEQRGLVTGYRAVIDWTAGCRSRRSSRCHRSIQPSPMIFRSA